MDLFWESLLKLQVWGSPILEVMVTDYIRNNLPLIFWEQRLYI